MTSNIDAQIPVQPPLRGIVPVMQQLLLVPEGIMIALLLLVHLASGGSSVTMVLVAILAASFTTRTVALHMARTAIEMAHYRQATWLIRLSLLLHPWSADTLSLRGALALAKGELEEAKTSLQRSINLLFNQSAPHAALSSAFLESGHPREAAQSARQALVLNEQYALAYLYLAEAERAQGASTYTVEEHLRAGLAVAQSVTDTAALQCTLARHLLNEQRIAEATLVLHSAEKLLPRCSVSRQAELCFHLGELLIAQGQAERAREYFRGVENLDPHGRYAAAAWRASRL